MNNQYVLLKPVTSQPRTEQITFLGSKQDLLDWLKQVPGDDVVALDFETSGLKVYREDVFAVGFGLSCSFGSCYYPLNDLPAAEIADLLLTLKPYNLINHNVYFDDLVYYKYTSEHASWVACTFGYCKQLASEGWPGQQWGLKPLEKSLLGWADTNERGVDEWLVINGYTSNTSIEQKDGYYWHEEKQRYLKPDKGEMWRVPPTILGHYCALDADAAYQLYTQVILPCLARLTPVSRMYHTELFIPNIYYWVEATHTGIKIDTEYLAEYKQNLIECVEVLYLDFVNMSEVRPLMEEWRDKVIQEDFLSAEPNKFNKFDPGTEPARFNKKGVELKGWQNWKAKVEAGPQVSKNWLKWSAKVEAARSDAHYLFNLGSTQQLKWLLYDKLFSYEVTKEHVNEDDRGQILLHACGKSFELDMTDSGGLPTDETALMAMGEVGNRLSEYKMWLKLLDGYVCPLEELVYNGRYHPSVRINGTITGRVGGDGGFSVITLPKTDFDFLKVFVSDPDYVFLNCDVTSLENVVLAEISQDPYLLGLYGPDANPNHDAYLYLGLSIPSLRKKIIDGGYDPVNPTKEGVKRAKSECKKIRDALKVVILSGNYGAGANKMYKALMLKGFDFTLQEVREINKGFKEAKPGVLKLARELEQQYAENGGWVWNPIGRPMAIAHNKKKDLINTVSQSGGHDAMMALIIETFNRFKAEGIRFKQAIPDFHDDVVPQVHKDDAERAMRIMQDDAYKAVNSWLNGTIPLKGVANKATDLKGIKKE